MKFALVLLVVLPLAMAATIDEKRLEEQILEGIDIPGLAKQFQHNFTTEIECEMTQCPQHVEQLLHEQIASFKSLLCAAVCKEAQILAQQIHV